MVALILPCAAALCFVLAVVGWRQARSTGLEEMAGRFNQVEETVRPPLTIRVIDGVGLGLQRWLLALYGPRRRARLDDRLDRAGRPEGLTERAFLLRQSGFISIGLLVLVLTWILGVPLAGLLVLALCAVWMDVWLRAVVRRRQAEIGRRLPDFLDVLAVTVTAGLGLQTALERVASADDSPLGEEIRRMLDEMRYGLSRRSALEALRRRNNAPALASFVTAMMQAEELGTPLAQALNDIAAEVRRESAQTARQAAARAGSKVSLVVSMTIVPGAMLLIIASMVLANLPRFRAAFGG